MVPLRVTLGPSMRWSLTTEMGHCAEWCLERELRRRDTWLAKYILCGWRVCVMGYFAFGHRKATLTLWPSSYGYSWGALDIDLIRDEANVATHARASWLRFLLLGTHLAEPRDDGGARR
ncbi:hypothetical protein H5410_005356 [Solanum commersonii]|uniref:Uncharacterized protein n=1 Tax=Solanum commersonii TaxID=4109 RepID=A0A9J6A719_SOLCO|nr:hypothetical protein H5410_005356 [Solanum commersonii]